MSWRLGKKWPKHSFALACWLLVGLAGVAVSASATSRTECTSISGVGVYLNPNTGRFWTSDSYAGNNNNPLSLHKFLYSQDEPVNDTDPSGKSVYVCTRPLNIKGHENDGNNACHVFLAFDSDGMKSAEAWEDAVKGSWDATKHPNTYGIQYSGDPDNPTFSFHPKSVLTGDESEEYGGPLLTPGSYVADQAYLHGLRFISTNQASTSIEFGLILMASWRNLVQKVS